MEDRANNSVTSVQAGSMDIRCNLVGGCYLPMASGAASGSSASVHGSFKISVRTAAALLRSQAKKPSTLGVVCSCPRSPVNSTTSQSADALLTRL